MKHQAQVTILVLSYKYFFFSSATVPWETLNCSKSFTVVWEDGICEGLFDKEFATPPPDIHNPTAPLSAPGGPIEAGIFNDSNQEEDIELIMNQGLEVYYGM